VQEPHQTACRCAGQRRVLARGVCCITAARMYTYIIAYLSHVVTPLGEVFHAGTKGAR